MRVWVQWALAIVLSFVLLVGLASSFVTDPHRKITAEHLFTVGLLLVILFFGEIREVTIGPFLKLRKDIEEVKHEQARLAQEIQTITTMRAQQTQHLTLQGPAPGADAAVQVLIQDLQEKREEVDQLQAEANALREQTQYQEQTEDELRGTIEELENNIAAAQEQINTVFDLAERWEFMYIDRFYVDNTKRILNRLVQRGQMPEAEFNAMARLIGITNQNLVTTVNVLQGHGMIEVGQDGVIRPTDRARRFLQYIGFTEPIPPEILNWLLRLAVERGAIGEGPPPPPPAPGAAA